MTLGVDETVVAETMGAPGPPATAEAPARPDIVVPQPSTAEPEAASARAVNPTITILAATLSSAAAAWMVAGMFRDFSAHLIALFGVGIGAGLLLLAQRSRNAAWVEYVVLPIALLAGVVLVAPDIGGNRSFTDVVSGALKAGGLLQPPVSFDPGWRFILVVLFAPLTAGAARLAISLNRPKLAVICPVILALGAGIVQPASTEVASVAVALVLVVVALTLAYGADLGSSGQLSAAFEARRLLRGGGFAVAIAALVLGLSNVGFLFPQPNQQHVIPPQKPPIPPPIPDQVLFNYTAKAAIPLRMGVIDIYDASQQAWLLPPYDTSRFERITPPTGVPGTSYSPSPSDIDVTVSMVDATGHSIPSIGGMEAIRGAGDVVDYDPRTNEISLADRPIYQGYRYTLIGAPPPGGKQLAQSGSPPPSLEQFLAIPPPPNEVVTLLNQYAQQAAQAHVAANAWDRLVFLRGALYSKVVSAGQGTPIDITPLRVGQMLDGGKATPYEINAAEAMLARWAGLPSRIGYGYYGGVQQKNGSFDVHPVNAAMWLEVYFNHYGWIPIVGVPPRAEGSTSQSQKNQVQSSPVNELQLEVYIPIRQPSVELLFEYLRWYLLRVLPAVAGGLLLVAAYPWLLKYIRRRKRVKWGRAHGPAGRIAAAYAEFRDRARDLAVGDPSATPVRFLRFVAHDREHRELAWLTSRALWGDLRRDLQDEDADVAEQLAKSVTKRLDRAQPGVNRMMARIARSSLRQPYSREVPNLWPERRLDLRFWRALPVIRGRRVPARSLAAAAAAGIISIVGVSCGGSATHPGAAGNASQRVLPMHLVPASLGVFSFHREASAEALYRSAGPDALVSNGLVYAVQYGAATEGAVEVALFDPDVDVSDINNEALAADCAENPADCPGHEVFRGVQTNLGTGHFQRVYYRNYERAYEMSLLDERLYLWFPPGTQTMVTLVVINQVPPATADALFHALMDGQHGRPPTPIPAFKFTQSSAQAVPSGPGFSSQALGVATSGNESTTGGQA